MGFSFGASLVDQAGAAGAPGAAVNITQGVLPAATENRVVDMAGSQLSFANSPDFRVAPLPQDDAQNRLVTVDPATGQLRFRDVASLPTGPATDNTITTGVLAPAAGPRTVNMNTNALTISQMSQFFLPTIPLDDDQFTNFLVFNPTTGEVNHKALVANTNITRGFLAPADAARTIDMNGNTIAFTNVTGYVINGPTLITGKLTVQGGIDPPTYLELAPQAALPTTDGPTNPLNTLWIRSTDSAIVMGANGETVLGTLGQQPQGPQNLGFGTPTATDVPLQISGGTGVTFPSASPTLAGMMSATDKVKLDGISPGQGANITTGTLAAATDARILNLGGQLLRWDNLANKVVNVNAGGQFVVNAPTISLSGATVNLNSTDIDIGNVPATTTESNALMRDVNGKLNVRNIEATHINLTLAADWQNFGQGWQTLGISRHSKMRHLYGVVVRPTGTSNLIATLDPQDRPPFAIASMAGADGGPTDGMSKVDIRSDGTVTLRGTTGTLTAAMVVNAHWFVP